jgi:hypothetical protein
VELWADEAFEMLVEEVKDKDAKFTWKIVGSKRGHVSYRKTGNKNQFLGKFYEA